MGWSLSGDFFSPNNIISSRCLGGVWISIILCCGSELLIWTLQRLQMLGYFRNKGGFTGEIGFCACFPSDLDKGGLLITISNSLSWIRFRDVFSWVTVQTFQIYLLLHIIFKNFYHFNIKEFFVQVLGNVFVFSSSSGHTIQVVAQRLRSMLPSIARFEQILWAIKAWSKCLV